MPPQTKPKPLAPQVEAFKPWDDPSLRPPAPAATPTPSPKPTPPGTPVGAAPYEPGPYTYETPDPVSLAAQLEYFRKLAKSAIPEWLWNSPQPKPTPPPQ